MGFENFWENLKRSLGSETLIKNWTKDSGHLKRGDFEAVWKGGDYIEYVGKRKKKVTHIEVKETELDEMMKKTHNSVQAQFSLF